MSFEIATLKSTQSCWKHRKTRCMCGKREVNNIAQHLLLTSFTTADAQQIVIDAGWSEARQQRAAQNKTDREAVRTRGEQREAREAKRARSDTTPPANRDTGAIEEEQAFFMGAA